LLKNSFSCFPAPSEVAEDREVLNLNRIDQNDEEDDEDLFTAQPQKETEYGYNLRPPQMNSVYTNQNTQPTNNFRYTNQQTGKVYSEQSSQTEPYEPRGLNVYPLRDVRKFLLTFVFPFSNNLLNAQMFIRF